LKTLGQISVKDNAPDLKAVFLREIVVFGIATKNGDV
jgi:hypothetical protein